MSEIAWTDRGPVGALLLANPNRTERISHGPAINSVLTERFAPRMKKGMTGQS